MLLDVSGVSTPTGTPRAAHRDLEGSLAGSARGEGSVADADDLSRRLEGMDVREDGKEEVDGEKKEQLVDRDPTPETPKADDPVVDKDEQEDVVMAESNEQDDGGKEDQSRVSDTNVVEDKGDGTETIPDTDAGEAEIEAEKGHDEAEPVPEVPVDGNLTHDPQGVLKDPEAKVEYTTKNEDADSKPPISSTSDKRDPNQDEDLDALKQGKLHDSGSDSLAPGEPEAGKHTLDQNPVNNLVEASLSQDVTEHQLSTDETKHQGGVAGQRMKEVDNANQVIQPDDEADSVPRNASTDGGPEIRDVTPVPVSTEDDEHLGPRGALDGPQKFNVEWLEQGRGQSKAADLDEQEYHFKDTSGEDKLTKKGESESAEKSKGQDVKSEDKQDGLQSTDNDRVELPTATATATTDAGANDHTVSGSSESQEKELLQSQEDMAPLLPDAPSTEPKIESSRPTQIHIEPAPIAQPATTADDDVTPGATLVSESSALDTSPTANDDDADADANAESSSAPQFPNAPSEDPDVVDPISQPQSRPGSGAFDDSESGVSTPIDPSFVRAFPEVPDEEKPRVEVHVSSPVNTPKKETTRQEVGSDDHSRIGGEGVVNADGTPVADLPGTSKSLSYPDLSRSESGLSESDENNSNTKTPEGLNKRLSARRSPKSPLLGDEDPGDFTPGEGWAVVTK